MNLFDEIKRRGLKQVNSAVASAVLGQSVKSLNEMLNNASKFIQDKVDAATADAMTEAPPADVKASEAVYASGDGRAPTESQPTLLKFDFRASPEYCEYRPDGECVRGSNKGNRHQWATVSCMCCGDEKPLPPESSMLIIQAQIRFDRELFLRSEFEATASASGLDLGCSVTGRYFDPETDKAWETWKRAARSSDQSRLHYPDPPTTIRAYTTWDLTKLEPDRRELQLPAGLNYYPISQVSGDVTTKIAMFDYSDPHGRP